MKRECDMELLNIFKETPFLALLALVGIVIIGMFVFEIVGSILEGIISILERLLDKRKLKKNIK